MSSTPAAVYTDLGEPLLFENPYHSLLKVNDDLSPESIIAKEVDKISQDIISHLRVERRYSPFFTSGCMGNAQYLIDYATLIRTFVAPMVSRALPNYRIRWRLEHGQDCIGQTMTQFTISCLNEVQHGHYDFSWDQVNFRY